MAGKATSLTLGEAVFYDIRVNDWSWPYSFGVNWKPDNNEPYLDYRFVNLSGTLLAPKSVKAKSVRLVLVPRHFLNENERKRSKPTGVGSIDMYRGAFQAFLSFPSEDLLPLLTTLAAGRIKFATLEGTKMRYGKADVRHFAFAATSEDYPE